MDLPKFSFTIFASHKLKLDIKFGAYRTRGSKVIHLFVYFIVSTAAILDLKVKMKPDHKIDIRNQFVSPINPKKHILYNTVGQTIKKIIKNITFKMAMAAILDFGL